MPTVIVAATLISGARPALAESVDAPGRSRPAPQSVYAVVYKPGPRWKLGVPMEEQGLQAHFHYLRGLAISGKVALAGPWGADGGLVLLRAEDEVSAERLVAADPAVIAGLFRADIRRFKPRLASDEPVQVERQDPRVDRRR